MKRSALYFIFFVSSMILVLSCSKDYEESIYPETSDTRTKKLMDSIHNILFSSPAWKVVVYADSASYKSNRAVSKLPFTVRLDEKGIISARRVFSLWSDTAYFRLKMAMEPEFIFSNIGKGDLVSRMPTSEYRIRHCNRDSIGLLGRLGESIVMLYPLKDENGIVDELLKENWMNSTTGNISIESEFLFGTEGYSSKFSSVGFFKLLYPNTTFTLDNNELDETTALWLGQFADQFRFVLKPTGSKNKIERIESVDVEITPPSFNFFEFMLKNKQCEFSFDPSTNILKIKARLFFDSIFGSGKVTIDQTITLVPSTG